MSFVSNWEVRLILSISLMLVVSKRECSRGIFQFETNWVVFKLNRWETSRLGNGWESKGEGEDEKEAMVGIQGELDIERDDELWILKQAPFLMKQWDFRIDFHSLKEEEREGGRERSWSLGTYLTVVILTKSLNCWAASNQFWRWEPDWLLSSFWCLNLPMP